MVFFPTVPLALDWTLVERLFHDALELDESARAVYVQAEAGGDPRVVREVLALVRSAEQSPAFLEIPLARLGRDVG